jgi:RHS repeat-associated protein
MNFLSRSGRRCRPEPFTTEFRKKGRRFIAPAGAITLAFLAVAHTDAQQDPATINALWVAESSGGLKIATADGSLRLEIPGLANVRAVAVDHHRPTIWLYGGQNLYAYGYDGSQELVVPLSLPDPASATLAVNEHDGSIWLGADQNLVSISSSGQVLRSLRLVANVKSLAIDSAGSLLWVGTSSSATAFDALGGTQISSLDLGSSPDLRDLDLDPTGRVWVALASGVRRYAEDGTLLLAAALTGALHVAGDNHGGAWIANTKDLLRLSPGGQVTASVSPFDDQGKIVEVVLDPSNDDAWVANETAVAQVDAGGRLVRAFQFQPPVHIWDLALYADVIPPQLTLIAPADGSYLNTKTPTFKVAYTDIGSGVNPATLAFRVNGMPLQVSCANTSGGASCMVSDPLIDGIYSVTGTVEDYAGNTSPPAGVTFTVDTTPPSPISASKVVVSAPSGGQVTLTAGSGSAEPGAMASITNSRTGQVTSVTVAGDGSLVATVAGQAGDVLQIVLTDAAGNHGSATSVTVPGNPGSGGLPPDPATVASPIDPTVPTDIAVATAFLYSGSNPIQTGVAPGTIDPRRAAVLRGQVLDRNGSPLPGVTVTVLGHPELGSTLSRLDGLFDLVVNGGGTVVVQYDKSGYARTQRRVPAPWRDYSWVESVVLVPYDTRVTMVTTGSAVLQVARGTTASDQDGSRTATLLFPPGTQASMTLADGSSKPLPTLSVRATEFTVGGTGPAAMPAKLPPTSAYTYAVELSCDEAQSAGAQSVTFNQPVVQYVENFLAFPVGGTVPVGYYDRALAAWVASANGRVIGLLSVTNGLADLDLTGTGSAATATDLAALGVSDAERGELAVLYQPGQSLWRVPISHFTPYDWNWPYFPPTDATPPNQPPPQLTDKPEDDSDCQHGSTILCQNQALGETVPIVGTPLSLRYVSDRVPGHSTGRSITIPLSGPTVPASLKRIELQVAVAGQLFTQTFPAAPNQSYLFTAPGLDAYGRPLQGDAKVTVVIGYVYGATYALPVADGLAFAQFRYPTVLATFLNRATNEYTPRQQYESYLGTLGFWDARGVGLGGWTLNVHHTYDSNSGTLYYGSGRTKRTSASSYGRIVSPAVALSATESALCLAGDDVGNLYLCSSNHILKVATDGTVTTVAGQTLGGFAGDGGPATAAMLSQPRGVAADRSGNLYIADTFNNRIRKVDNQGIITTIAGNNGSGCIDPWCNNVPASLASLTQPQAITVDGEGNIYVADTGIGLIRRIGLDGIITTVAGNGGFFDSGDGAATSLALRGPRALAFDNSGNLLIGDTGNNRALRINANGSVTEVAGGPGPTGLAMDQEGSLFVASIGGFLGGTVAKWLPDLSRAVIAGEVSSFGSTLANLPATATALNQLFGAVLDGDGSILVADGRGVLRIGNLLPGFSAGELDIPSENGEDVYVFDSEGRHLRTTNALTGATLLTFGYDLSGRLASVTDADGNTTTIERDSSGQMTAIIAPFGQRTPVTVGSSGYVATITDPAGEAVNLTYQAGGLLATRTDAKGNASHLTYDPVGRLVLDSDAASGYKQLTRTERPTGYTVGLVTALGRASSYSIDEDLAGDKTRSNVSPAGLVSTTLMKTDGSETTISADGTAVSLRWGPDPRFGMLAPVVAARQVTTPAGLVNSSSFTRSLSTQNNVPVLTDALTINGNTFTKTFDASQRLYALTTPLGRQLSTLIDSEGRPVRTVAGNLAPTLFAYDGQGRLTSFTAGTGPDARSFTLSYDALGRVATVTDPLQQTVGFVYDQADRAVLESLPDGQALAISFDGNGQALTFTPPGRTAHAFAYSAVDLLTSYTAPTLANISSSTAYTYDSDHGLISVTRPDGRAVSATYDGAGRLHAITDDRGSRTVSYDPSTGNVSSITATDGGQLSYLYDGFLLKRTTWSGIVGGTIDRSYDAEFRVASISIDGGNATPFLYDADGLLKQAGDLVLSYDPQNASLTASNLGVVATSTTYNAFGEPTAVSTAANGTALYTSQYTRDQLGRITQKIETIDATTDTYTYSYDARGRLTTVAKDGTTLSTYAYDATGNRLSWTGSTGMRAGTYDNQDRLLQYGDLNYTYQPSGELASETQNGQTMSFTFDTSGNLREVTTPTGIAISYLVDGRNRRIGKMVNGTLVSGFLYRDQLAPVAQLDGSGNVVAVFVYATRLNVPDYMITGGKIFRIVTDHLGSPRLVIDTATGDVLQRMDYDEFGQVELDTNPGFQPFGFAGGLYDLQTGLVHFGYRDYDPQVGRWTTKDPLGLAAGEVPYRYAGDDPVNHSDPTGLRDCDTYQALWDWLCQGINDLAKSLGIDPSFLFALAGKEAGWNDANMHPNDPNASIDDVPRHAAELNNPFGVTAGGGNDLSWSSLGDAMDYWGNTYGHFVKGDKSIDQFMNGLKEAKYNSRDPKYYKKLKNDYDQAKWFAENCDNSCRDH